MKYRETKVENILLYDLDEDQISEYRFYFSVIIVTLDQGSIELYSEETGSIIARPPLGANLVISSRRGSLQSDDWNTWLKAWKLPFPALVHTVDLPNKLNELKSRVFNEGIFNEGIIGTPTETSDLAMIIETQHSIVKSSNLQAIVDSSENICPQMQAIVHLDSITEQGVSGWSQLEGSSAPVLLSLYIDDNLIQTLVCNKRRDDVLAAGHQTAEVGFNFEIPNSYFDEAPHTVVLLAEGPATKTVVLGHAAESMVFQYQRHQITGYVDGLHDGAVHGWVMKLDRVTGYCTGGAEVLITLSGHPIAQVTASQFRADVSSKTNGDPNCGFVFAPPPGVLSGKTVDLSFKVLPSGQHIKGSPARITFPQAETYKKIRALQEEIDGIFRQLWHLRASAKAIEEADRMGLNLYHIWAQQYFKRLHERNSLLPCNGPLVSIICPVYRPRLKDVSAAIESIVNQTYQDWELILVDDASGDKKLSKTLSDYVRTDSRVRLITRKKNRGISDATNSALRIAKGKYIAFFDHDDLLVDVALSIYVSEAQRTGAQILYCDEDKIDDSGFLSDPNFKSDWNYRLVLSQNYICHLLFVDHEVLKKIGPVRGDYDGAQDHDLVLRLSEVVPGNMIFHIPEVLYHWRKTPTSTAASGSAKKYAVNAAIRAVSDHIKRRGKIAAVTSPLDVTWNLKTEWSISDLPKVSIIIPYREQIELTRECVNAIRQYTAYENYELILVDNWSTSSEARQFAEEIRSANGTYYLSVPEPFNYSRINNLAVSHAKGDLLLLMNNDVIVSSTNWLNVMVGELLAEADIGAVGIKLLYSNGIVQHGGVILGVGGVADHAHKGLMKEHAGYLGRALCAQEMSAVTAACLLCSKKVFEEVGGFDETDLQVAYNDVDLCLKIRGRGYKVIWTPDAVAEHRESISRGSDFKPEHQVRFFHENEVMRNRWKYVLDNDPYYNKNFSRRGGIFSDLSGEVWA